MFNMSEKNLNLFFLIMLVSCFSHYCQGKKDATYQELDLECRKRMKDEGSECLAKHRCWYFLPNNSISLKGYDYRNPSYCIKEEKREKICCPQKPIPPQINQPSLVALDIVRKKCAEYNRTLYLEIVSFPHGKRTVTLEPKCPFTKDLIFRGEAAKPKEFPHMALLGFKNNNKIEWKCGGSLISQEFVLSAAHCNRDPKGVYATLVMLGAVNYNTSDETAKYYSIVKRFVHPNFTSPSLHNDIVLFKLNVTVTITDFIRPICLPTSDDVSLGRNVTVTGWGNLDTIAQSKGELMKANVLVLPNNNCISSFKDHPFYPDGVKNLTILCAGNKGKNRTQSACMGDSGGPLQIELEPCLWLQRGIISSSSAICGDNEYPAAIYTKVFHYINWIQPIVWPENVTENVQPIMSIN